MAADIFRVLSRSTKLTKGAKQAVPQNYPSSGQRSRPQAPGEVYESEGIHVADSHRATKSSRKRKRGKATPEEVTAEIDFFGDGAVQPPSIVHRDHGTSHAVTHDVVNGGGHRPLAEEDCKRILKSHKVKITILEDWIPSPKERNKRKRADSSKASTKKKHKMQLYPEPLQSFQELSPCYNLSSRLLQNIDAQGYTSPTDIQMTAIPLLLNSREQATPDLLSVAPTGSGKTLAFLIPTMDSIMRVRKQALDSTHAAPPREDSSAEDCPLAIVLAPTKELASQIVNEGRKLAYQTGIKVALMRKDMAVIDREDAAEQPSLVEELADGESLLDEHVDEGGVSERAPSKTRVKAHILVSTPLTLLNALTRPDHTTAPLPTVRRLVLDEADVLLDPLFRQQVLSIWNACTHLDLQTSLWSATMGSNIEVLARDALATRHTALTLTDVPDPRAPLLRVVIGIKDTALPTISHKLIYAASESGKLMAVRQLLHPTAPSTKSGANDLSGLHPPFLIFTQTISRAIALAAELKYDIPPTAGGPSRIACLHSDLTDHARDVIMTGFRRGELWVLITTDLLARGVDFRGVNGVVNYDVPTSAAAYVHRAGRTGRAGREGGVAVTLYAEEDVPFLKPIANIISVSQRANGSNDTTVQGLQSWMLNALPTPTKREKQRLKQRGVEARRPGMEKSRISTKSGYERREEQRRRDGKEKATKRRMHESRGGRRRLGEGDEDADGENFEGFDN